MDTTSASFWRRERERERERESEREVERRETGYCGSEWRDA